MRWLTLLMVVALVGCSAPDRGPAPVAVPTDAPTASPEPAPTAPPAAVAAPQLENPVVVLSSGTFPIVPSLTLRAATVSADVVANVNVSLGLYLMNLNGYRDGGFDERGQLYITGAFRDAVIAGLKGSATPGVKRKLELESVRVDRYLVKPWGTPALAEVTATIVDRAIDGSAPDQRETGRLRLTGQRLRVADAWNDTRGAWFNGPTWIASERSADVTQALVMHLRSESWVAGAPAETYFGSAGETPYQAARATYRAAFDRTAIASRTFEGVTAVIERYDGFAEIADGLATVGVTGTVVVKDSGGATTRSPFHTRVVVLFGNWSPEVIDEELSPGVWRSAGDRALSLIDVSRA